MVAEYLSIWSEGVAVINMEGVVISGGDPPAALSPVGFWNPRMCSDKCCTSKKCRVTVKYDDGFEVAMTKRARC